MTAIFEAKTFGAVLSAAEAPSSVIVPAPVLSVCCSLVARLLWPISSGFAELSLPSTPCLHPHFPWPPRSRCPLGTGSS